MFYVHTRNRPAQVYETKEITRDSYGITFIPNYPHGFPQRIKTMVPWGNVDHIQELEDEPALKVV